MVCKNLEHLVKYIQIDILNNDLLEISFSKEEILVFILESRIPIRVHKIKIYPVNEKGIPTGESEIAVAAELYSELLRNNLGSGEIYLLDKVIDAIEENDQIFENLLTY